MLFWEKIKIKSAGFSYSIFKVYDANLKVIQDELKSPLKTSIFQNDRILINVGACADKCSIIVLDFIEIWENVIYLKIENKMRCLLNEDYLAFFISILI